LEAWALGKKMSMINLNVKGMDKVQAGLKQLATAIPQTMKNITQEVGSEVLDTTGLRSYPGLTAANMPPTPYYIRGKGTQYKSGNSGKSENLGKQWKVDNPDTFSVRMKNDVSYAPFVNGEDQASALKAIGWRILPEVAQEKIDKLRAIVEAWITRMIVKAGL
jgi:hypothetical protein